MKETVIELDNVSKIYYSNQQETPAIKDITFQVSKREFVTIVGPSGCGKTTILNVIAGLVKPTKGQCRMDGKEVEKGSGDLGMVFQSPTLMKWRTVLDNVLIPIEIKGRERNEYIEKARDLLDLTGLKDFEKSYPSQLSGGMKQRVALVRGLIHDPSLLLMDEPFGALDAMTREEMNLELLKIWRQKTKTTVLVTHSIREAVFLSDRVVVMKGQQPGTMDDVINIDLERPRHPELSSSPEFVEIVKFLRSKFGLS